MHRSGIDLANVGSSCHIQYKQTLLLPLLPLITLPTILKFLKYLLLNDYLAIPRFFSATIFTCEKPSITIIKYNSVFIPCNLGHTFCFEII